MKPKSITESLPPALRAKLEITDGGSDRKEEEVGWYYRYLEMGDAAEAARFVGFEDDKAAAAGRRLKVKFAGIIREGLLYVGQTDLPVAKATLMRVMNAYDPDARILVKKTLKNGDVLEYEDADPVRSSPAAASAAVKAAESLLDRLGMPKGFVLTVEDSKDIDYRARIDETVFREGVAAVRLMPTIMGFRENREYFEEGVASGKYRQGVIDITPGPMTASGDSGSIAQNEDGSWSEVVTPGLASPVSSGAGDDVPTSALSPAGPETELSSEPEWL